MKRKQFILLVSNPDIGLGSRSLESVVSESVVRLFLYLSCPRYSVTHDRDLLKPGPIFCIVRAQYRVIGV